jgi:hypothetical protein
MTDAEGVVGSGIDEVESRRKTILVRASSRKT